MPKTDVLSSGLNFKDTLLIHQSTVFFSLKQYVNVPLTNTCFIIYLSRDFILCVANRNIVHNNHMLDSCALLINIFDLVKEN